MLSKNLTHFFFAIGLAASAALSIPQSVSANERILSVEEFEDISRGLTQYFFRDGAFFGAEQFFENRQTIWMFSNGQCETGTWWPQEDYICFQYETLPTPQCWHMIERDGDIFARLQGADPQFDLELKNLDRSDIPCEGPEVGS